MFIVVNSLNNEKISINPIHIVSVIGEACGSVITTLVEKYHVIETRQAVSDLVNGKSADTTPNSTPKIGDNYFYYDLVSEELLSGVYLDNDFHKFNIKYGNCFKTPEAAFNMTINNKSNFLKSLFEIRKNEKSN